MNEKESFIVETTSYKPYKMPWWNLIEKFKQWRLKRRLKDVKRVVSCDITIDEDSLNNLAKVWGLDKSEEDEKV
jgi:hypothetical protein